MTLSIKNLLKVLIFSSLLINFCFSLNAESFRVHKTVVITMDEITPENAKEDNYVSEEVTVGINDAVCIKLPQDLTYIQGVELTVKIPLAIARCPNTVIYSLYDNISPVPSEKNIDYTGKELYTGIYPGQLSLTIHIPLIKGNTIKQSPYADKTFIPEYSRNFLFLRNQLAMKGVPQEAINSKFQISAKPILINKGRLIVKAGAAKPQNLSVLVDDKPVELDANGACLLKPGIHNVIISSQAARNESRSCVIEIAKDTVLQVDLKSTAPVMQINMPQGTHVTVDSQNVEVKNGYLELKPGDHTLKFSLGGYEVVKQVNVQEGRFYSINVTIDAAITEN